MFQVAKKLKIEQGKPKGKWNISGLADNIIERDMISARTREALAYRKSLGVVLGRPKGSKTKHHKLDPYREKIEKWRAKGWSKAKISRKTKVCEKTLRRYMERNSLV